MQHSGAPARSVLRLAISRFRGWKELFVMSAWGQKRTLNLSRAMSALCQISEILGGYSRRLENELKDLQTSVRQPECPAPGGREGGHETFGAIDSCFCA